MCGRGAPQRAAVLKGICMTRPITAIIELGLKQGLDVLQTGSDEFRIFRTKDGPGRNFVTDDTLTLDQLDGFIRGYAAGIAGRERA